MKNEKSVIKNITIFLCAPLMFFLIFFFALSGLNAEGKKELAGRSAGTSSGDFAGRIELAGEPGTLLAFELPEKVYLGLERPDKGDIRVFDSLGTAVPFILRPPPEITMELEGEKIPFFLWDEGNENKLPGSADIEIDTQGAVVRIRNQMPVDETIRSKRSYLLDLTGLSYAPVSLEIEMDSEGRPFNTTVTIHTGTDLSAWRLYEKRQTLVHLAGAGSGGSAITGISKNTIELPPENFGSNALTTKYLLLGFDAGAPPPLEIKAVFENRRVPGLIREKTIRGEMDADRKTIAYNTGGFFSLVDLDFILPEPDSVPAVLKSRSDLNSSFTIREKLTVYRLRTGSGEERKVRAVAVSSSDPYWELEAAEGILFNVIPDCLVRWSCWEIIFLSRGEGPWTLAYGNRNSGPLPPALDINNIRGENELHHAVATGIESFEMRPIKPERKWGSWVLWGTLIAAVCVLFVLAFYIVKSMRSGKA